MALISLRQLLDHAAEHGYGVPAFNINNMEQMLAIMAAAKKTDSPVILQASRGARQYANDIVLKHLILGAIELYPEIPVCMHQDHGNSPATCAPRPASAWCRCTTTATGSSRFLPAPRPQARRGAPATAAASRAARRRP